MKRISAVVSSKRTDLMQACMLSRWVFTPSGDGFTIMVCVLHTFGAKIRNLCLKNSCKFQYNRVPFSVVDQSRLQKYPHLSSKTFWYGLAISITFHLHYYIAGPFEEQWKVTAGNPVTLTAERTTVKAKSSLKDNLNIQDASTGGNNIYILDG